MKSQLPGRFYDFCNALWSGILGCTMRWRVSGLEHVPPDGGCLLVICHLNHLDAVLVSSRLKRRVSWISRLEFFRHPLMRVLMLRSGTIPVDRQGWARPALRESLRRLAGGGVVGIFPEGEIMSGAASVLRGGPMRGGAAWLAGRSGRPVVPMVILGSSSLVRISPWLPARRGRLWLAAGPPLYAQPGESPRTRAGREAFNSRLTAEFQRLAAGLRAAWDLPDTVMP